MTTKIILFVLGIIFSIISYQQYSFYKKLSVIQNELLITRKQFTDFKEENFRRQVEIMSKVTASNNQLQKELTNEITKINTITLANRKHIDGVSQATASFEANYDSFTEATRKNYIETINKLFRESAELLTESSRAADESTAAAITYHQMLEDQYNIVNEVNNEK